MRNWTHKEGRENHNTKNFFISSHLRLPSSKFVIDLGPKLIGNLILKLSRETFLNDPDFYIQKTFFSRIFFSLPLESRVTLRFFKIFYHALYLS